MEPKNILVRLGKRVHNDKTGGSVVARFFRACEANHIDTYRDESFTYLCGEKEAHVFPTFCVVQLLMDLQIISGADMDPEIIRDTHRELNSTIELHPAITN